VKELISGRPILRGRFNAPSDEVGHFFVLNAVDRQWLDFTHDSVVNLGLVFALHIGSVLSNHLQHTHAKGIDVNLSVVVLLVNLWCNELGSAEH